MFSAAGTVVVSFWLQTLQHVIHFMSFVYLSFKKINSSLTGVKKILTAVHAAKLANGQNNTSHKI